ncbi:Uncharacterised protein [Myroides odoratus]|nr:hypothetical protein Myrod_3406 [Myroides odoratus DSM 2801]EKB05735.1 hypothetical protein HMPREF9716_02686 [Myroides odoratus CIP 103059]STZ31526.1 Uncharacterised protein [Myroides odoratus]
MSLELQNYIDKWKGTKCCSILLLIFSILFSLQSMRKSIISNLKQNKIISEEVSCNFLDIKGTQGELKLT